MVITDTFPCGICHKVILAHTKSVYCNHIKFWVPIKCNAISSSEYKELQKEPDDVPWFCLKCTQIMFPFGQLDNDELINLYDFDFPYFVDSMRPFEITFGLSNLPSLDNYDIVSYKMILISTQDIKLFKNYLVLALKKRYIYIYNTFIFQVVATIILLQNINPKRALCYGIHLIVRDLQHHVICAEISTERSML